MNNLVRCKVDRKVVGAMECVYKKIYCKTHKWNQTDFEFWNEEMHNAFYGETKKYAKSAVGEFLKFIGLKVGDLSRDELVQLLRQRILKEAVSELKRVKRSLEYSKEDCFESDVESGFFLLKLVQYAKSEESFYEKELLDGFVLSEKALYDLVVTSNDVCFEMFPSLEKVWNVNDHAVKDTWNEIKFMWEDSDEDLCDWSST